MVTDAGILDQVTQTFLKALQHDAYIIQAEASRIFYYLVLIQLVFTALWMSLSGESLQRFLIKMVQLSFSFGIFYALILFGNRWVPLLINGFIQLGQTAGVQSLDPSSIISQGMSISGAIFKGFLNWGLLSHPFVALIGAIVCVAVLVLYGLMSAELTIILVKSYIVVALGSLFFAFGGAEPTRAMTRHYLQSAIGLGLQLMTLYLLLGVGQQVGSTWAQMTADAAAKHALMPMLVILCGVIVYYMILKNIPPFIAGFSGVGGFRNYGDAAVTSAINAGISGARLLSKSVGLAGSASQGLAQVSRGTIHVGKNMASHYQQQGGGISGAQAGVSAAAKSLAGASTNTVKDWLMKENQSMSFGQKMNHHIANKVKGFEWE